MQKVELHTAFAWTCDNCGRDNFTRGIQPSPESLEVDERELLSEGEWVMRPNMVVCTACSTHFHVEEPSEPDEGDFFHA